MTLGSGLAGLGNRAAHRQRVPRGRAGCPRPLRRGARTRRSRRRSGASGARPEARAGRSPRGASRRSSRDCRGVARRCSRRSAIGWRQSACCCTSSKSPSSLLSQARRAVPGPSLRPQPRRQSAAWAPAGRRTARGGDVLARAGGAAVTAQQHELRELAAMVRDGGTGPRAPVVVGPPPWRSSLDWCEAALRAPRTRGRRRGSARRSSARARSSRT